MQITPKIGKETAREYAYRTIKDNIISLDLKPGSMVSESELSTQIGVSRTPVREALIELSKSNLVEIYPQKGSFISLIDKELVDEARFLRLVLETAMVELICDMATMEILLPMKDNVKLQEFYLSQSAPEKVLLLDNEFHKLLFIMAQKEHSYRLLQGLTIHFDRVRKLGLSSDRDMKNISDHKELLEAIEKKDKVLAKNIITRHLCRYQIDEKSLREEYPNYFK